MKRVSRVPLHVDNDSYYVLFQRVRFALLLLKHFGFVSYTDFLLQLLRLLLLLMLLLRCHLKHPRLRSQNEKTYKTASDTAIKNAGSKCQKDFMCLSVCECACVDVYFEFFQFFFAHENLAHSNFMLCMEFRIWITASSYKNSFILHERQQPRATTKAVAIDLSS